MTEHIILGISLIINLVLIIPAAAHLYELWLFKDFDK